MLLAIDIGNTNIVIGVIENDAILLTERISTNTTKTEMEYAIDIKTVLDLNGIGEDHLEGSIVSSVVPQITRILCRAVEKITRLTPLVVGPGVKNGLNIQLDNPSEMGADRVADAVAAIHEYPVPLVIVDMGTATTLSVIDEKKRFIGGIIMPGVRISLDALTARASKLSGISIEEPRSFIGRSTQDCMKSGVLYGNAAAIDGLVDRIEAELGQPVSVIATGGMSKYVTPHCRRDVIMDDSLLLKGLNIIYKKNR